MKKKLLLSLLVLGLFGCTSKKELEDLGIQSKQTNQSYGFNGSGFKGTSGTEPSKVWEIIPSPWQIYGFYSSYLNKHMYSATGLIHHSHPGLSWYFLERALGATDGEGKGNGKMITVWFNTYNEDLVLTTDPNEFNGKSGWKKEEDLGKSYVGNEQGSFPIFRYYRNSTKSHFYTRDKNELGEGKYGFVYEGVAFFLKEPAPYEARIHDSNFYRDQKTGSVYVIMEGQIRLVENSEVLTRIFNFRIKRPFNFPATSILPIDDIEMLQGTRGPAISADAKLYEDVNTGRRYFSDPQNGRGILKIIPSALMFDIYHFNDSSILKTRDVDDSRLQELKVTY